MKVYGVDFTSAPDTRKPITVAVGRATARLLIVDQVEVLPDFAAFEKFLARRGPWIAGFDFPFGIAREAVLDLAWPEVWTQLLIHCRRLGRAEFKRILDEYRKTRPKGQRYAKRAGDTASGAHPSVKFVNPPVAYMFLEGAARLATAGLHIPGLAPGMDERIALEAYPGMLVRSQLGIRDSYKNDRKSLQTQARKTVRRRILGEIEAGRPLGIALSVAEDVRIRAMDDGSGDALDAVICAIQACWGWRRRDKNYGLPQLIDPLEGWIVSAGTPTIS